MQRMIFLFVISLLFPINSFAKDAKLPFYFPAGVIQTKDPVRQMQEYVRYMTATTYRFQGNDHNPHGPMIPGSDSIVIETNIDSTTRIASQGKVEKCRIVLDHFVRLPDGKIRVTQLADQFTITEEELKVVSDDLESLVREASQNNYEFWKELSDVAMKARAAKIFAPAGKTGATTSELATVPATQVAEFQKMVDAKDPLYGISLRELHYLPRQVKPSDFVPRELHLGYNPELEGILGVCWLNSGVVYYNPQARILDYLTGRPKVLQHEMVHCNYNLEKFPMASGFDAELFAMFPEVFFDENQIDLFFHGYCRDLREICEIYFGFDFREAKKQIFRYDLAGSMIIDEEKYHEYAKRVDEIKRELARAVREYIVPEFYSDPLWWSAMHDKLRDKNGLLWIMMAKHYKPTILSNARETAIWLSAHHEEIMEMAKDAFKKSGENSGGMRIMVGGMKISPSLLQEMSKFLTPEEKRRVETYFEKNPREIEKFSGMSFDEAVKRVKEVAERRGEVMGYEK